MRRGFRPSVQRVPTEEATSRPVEVQLPEEVEARRAALQAEEDEVADGGGNGSGGGDGREAEERRTAPWAEEGDTTGGGGSDAGAEDACLLSWDTVICRRGSLDEHLSSS
ncbi:hypothetical protein ACP70R_038410 [Stipagrostis hirtigluma subsp. patula]